jgi:hypothetical protein
MLELTLLSSINGTAGSMAMSIPRGCTFELEVVSLSACWTFRYAEVNMDTKSPGSHLAPCTKLMSCGRILAHSGKVGDIGTALRDDLLTSRRQGLKFSYFGQFQKAVVKVRGREMFCPAQIFKSVLDTELKYQALRQPVVVETYSFTLCFLTSES